MRPLPGGAKQRLDEPAVAAAADHQQVSASRCIQQHSGGIPLGHHVTDWARFRAAGRLSDGVPDCFGRCGQLREILARYPS
jgi:hypothetical protein